MAYATRYVNVINNVVRSTTTFTCQIYPFNFVRVTTAKMV